MRHFAIPLASALIGLAAALPAHAAVVTWEATLSGAAEAIPNSSTGTGWARVTFDDIVLSLRVEAAFAGLDGIVTAAHIHCCTGVPQSGTAGAATPVPSFPGFPTSVNSGAYDQTFDLAQASSFNATFVTASGGTVDSARAFLLGGLDSGRAYFNIHTTVFGGGEIRGFFAPTGGNVPEPATTALAGLALGMLTLCRRRARA